MTIKVKDLHREWMKDPGYRAEYDALEEEFQLTRTLIEARTRAGLSQKELARRMKTSQSYMARIESGEVHPSTAALARIAHATGSKLKIVFEPMAASPTVLLHARAPKKRVTKKRRG
jgi:transcriptional regulator with XRE-family HTH domain